MLMNPTFAAYYDNAHTYTPSYAACGKPLMFLCTTIIERLT
jgi:hypothetical protein